MSDNKIELEMKRVFDVATKKGSINEEDVYFRLLKFDLSAQEIQKFIKKLESHGIKILLIVLQMIYQIFLDLLQ